MNELEHIIASWSIKILVGATVVLIFLAAYALHQKKLNETWKEGLFNGIVAAVMIPTLFLIASTIFLNTVSSSKGPVHWHADIEVWSCGQEINLRDPKGWWNNKIGTATLHEHNDKRIHLEGVVITPRDASLGKFFQVIEGSLNPTWALIPTNEGGVMLKNGSCPNGEQAELQVFAYKTDSEQYYSQQKLDNPADYIISPYSVVPEGDCIIVEFGALKSRTDKLCRSYQVAEKIGKLKGERVYGN